MRTLTTIIVIVLILLAGWWLLSLSDGTDPGTENGTTTPQGFFDSNALVVENQPPGNQVLVSAVVLEEPGFVSIHRSGNGQPGEILGVSGYLPAGTSSNVPVALQSSLASGTDLVAVLRRDDGDQRFTPATDPGVESDLSGEFVTMSFSVQAETVPDTATDTATTTI